MRGGGRPSLHSEFAIEDPGAPGFAILHSSLPQGSASLRSTLGYNPFLGAKTGRLAPQGVHQWITLKEA